MRADIYLVEKGVFESRSRASRAIAQGFVSIDGKAVAKPSEDVKDGEHSVTVMQNEKYVSRGGLKLEAALENFGISPEGLDCIDVGASTGGFTDCLLQNGAARVLAVDSGRGQLHGSIAEDARVTSLESFNARYLSRDGVGEFSFAVMDVSFISQTLIHPALADVLCDGGRLVTLVKPQFEAGRGALGKNGIVRSPRDREGAILKVIESAQTCGFSLIGVMRSPIEGGDGNVEYLAAFERTHGDVSPIGDAERAEIRSMCAERQRADEPVYLTVGRKK